MRSTGRRQFADWSSVGWLSEQSSLFFSRLRLMKEPRYHDLAGNYLRPVRKPKPNFPGAFGLKLFLFCLLVFVAVFLLNQKNVQIPYLSKWLR
jgi:hypothetical protein